MHFYIDKTTNTIYYRETYGELEYDIVSTHFYNQILNLYNSYGFDFAYHLVIHNIILPCEFLHNPNTQNIIKKFLDKNPNKKQHIINNLDDLFRIATKLNNIHQINSELVDSDPNTNPNIILSKEQKN